MDRQFMCNYQPKGKNLKIDNILLCSDGANLTRLEFICAVDSRLSGESKRDSLDFGVDSPSRKDSQKSANLPNEKDSPNLPIFTQTKKWLDLYFIGEIPQWTPRFAFPSGASAFSLRVWEILQGIPYGKTTTYGAIAKQIAREFGIAKMSAQAVGGAVSRNPICIIVPCHRVVGANGNLTGYAGGLENKIALLKIEGIATNRLKMPKI